MFAKRCGDLTILDKGSFPIGDANLGAPGAPVEVQTLVKSDLYASISESFRKVLVDLYGPVEGVGQGMPRGKSFVVVSWALPCPAP